MVTIIVTRMDYGNLISLLTAPLGCLMLWRRMSFCRHHGTWNLTWGSNCWCFKPSLWLGVAGTAILLVAILWALHDNRLPNDALLALCSATLLCSGLLFIQHVPSLRPELLSYLFGDLLSIDWPDLPVFTLIIAVSLTILYRFWQPQIQIAIDPDIAISEGVNAKWQRLILCYC